MREHIKVGTALKFIAVSGGYYTPGGDYVVEKVTSGGVLLSDDESGGHPWDYETLSHNFELCNQGGK